MARRTTGMIQNLSSSQTWVTKFELPSALLLGAWLFLPTDVEHGVFSWLALVGWLTACAGVVAWTWPMKTVALEDNVFLISNWFSTRRVPSTHLRKISESRMNREPTITLYFDPPTPFGGKVRIVPPFSLT